MVELTKQDRKCGKSTAESHGSLSLGLFATALLPDALWQILSLVILGAAFALSSIYVYLVLLFRWKRTVIFEKATEVRIEHVSWFLGFAVLGISLVRAEVDCLVIPGVICVCLGYAILLFGIWKGSKEARKQKEVHQKRGDK